LPDLQDLEARQVWNRCSSLAGIDFNPEGQVACLTEIGQHFGRECDWPLTSTGDPARFHTENGCFSYGCAASTHGILRKFKPRRVIEIGSGNSSLVIAAALGINSRETGKTTEYAIVDPYPRSVIENSLPELSQLIRQRVELLDVSFFDQLRDKDVLFVDSGHTVRIGGDVNYLVLDVLPRLAGGVLVHFHDIPLPYEYPKVYATNPQFRQFWTEGYLLQAFLSFNREFEILLAMGYLMTEHQAMFRAAFPLYDPSRHRAISHSFWIHRK
jgi:hypothetical protein